MAAASAQKAAQEIEPAASPSTIARVASSSATPPVPGPSKKHYEEAVDIVRGVLSAPRDRVSGIASPFEASIRAAAVVFAHPEFQKDAPFKANADPRGNLTEIMTLDSRKCRKVIDAMNSHSFQARYVESIMASPERHFEASASSVRWREPPKSTEHRDLRRFFTQIVKALAELLVKLEKQLSLSSVSAAESGKNTEPKPGSTSGSESGTKANAQLRPKRRGSEPSL